MRLRAIAGLAALTLLAGSTPAGAADGLQLTEAKSNGFPDRAYILTLPEAKSLREAQVTVRENDETVDGLRLEPAGAASGVMLAIDASKTMRTSIDETMAAARQFAEQRRPDQKLGVMFFSGPSTVALEPTTDQAAIDRVLATPPPLTFGTRLFDATAKAIESVKRADVSAGSVIVLSDGADVESRLSGAQVVAQARKAKVRVFGIGMRSPSFDSASLRAFEPSGGVYAEAKDPRELSAIYRDLARQQGREFLLSYRSRQPLEHDIAVAVTVSGVADTVTAAYRTPGFPVPPAIPQQAASWWESETATYAIIVAMALLLGSGLWTLVRPIRATLSERLATFTGDTLSLEDEARAQRARAMLAAADGRLSDWRPWQNFTLDVELAKLPWTPKRIAAAAAIATVVLTGGLVALGAVVIAVVFAVGVPLTTRLVVAHLAKRVRRRFEAQLPDNLQVLASALRAGHSFVGALGVMVGDAPEPSRKEFRRVVQDERLGVPVEASLEVVDNRMRCEDLVYVGLIATLSRDTGGNTAEVLDKVVETMRERAKIRRLVRTLTAQGRLGGWIITALPVGMVVFLNLVQPDYMTPMLDNTLGWVILVFAGMLVALGAYSIRRIVDIKV